mmetsp:Transcript_92298/g.183813  ORF Transcript_92298/g.183813 Transcript_92298/m.183813 type:complete len:318 (+) Transcript_92298:207-1160(+)
MPKGDMPKGNQIKKEIGRNVFRHGNNAGSIEFSLPLNSRWRLGGNVVSDPVDSLDFVDDASRNLGKNFVGKVIPIRSHVVRGLHAAHGARALVGAAVAHDPDGLAVEEHDKGLADVGVLVARVQLFDQNRVCLPRHVQALPAELAEDSDGEAGPREGVPPHAQLGHPQHLPQLPHLVLEQFPQRLDEFQVHVLGEPAHVVVRLDGGTRALVALRLNHVGVQSALQEKVGVFNLEGLGLKELDERVADDLAFRFRLAHALQLGEKHVFSLEQLQVDAELPLKPGHHLGALVLAQAPVVHQNRVEAVPDGFVHEHGGNR